MNDSRSTTELLVAWSRGDRSALAELTPRVYRELHALARTYLNRDRLNRTLQPTALINEVYLRLIDQAESIEYESRSHFLGIAARLMRLILVDHARVCRAAKRGGGATPITLEESAALTGGQTPEILDIDKSLTRLARVDARKAKTIEMRYFGGMTREEVAAALAVTVATVKRDLRLGEAWIRRDLATRSGSGGSSP